MTNNELVITLADAELDEVACRARRNSRKTIYASSRSVPSSRRCRRRKVLTYLATPEYIDNSLKPYGWYKDFVLAGGREHGLPPEYIAEYVQSVEAIEDPNKTRDKKQRATLGGCGS